MRYKSYHYVRNNPVNEQETLYSRITRYDWVRRLEDESYYSERAFKKIGDMYIYRDIEPLNDRGFPFYVNETCPFFNYEYFLMMYWNNADNFLLQSSCLALHERFHTDAAEQNFIKWIEERLKHLK